MSRLIKRIDSHDPRIISMCFENSDSMIGPYQVLSVTASVTPEPKGEYFAWCYVCDFSQLSKDQDTSVNVLKNHMGCEHDLSVTE